MLIRRSSCLYKGQNGLLQPYVAISCIVSVVTTRFHEVQVIDTVRGILGGPDKGCIWIPKPSYINKIVNNYFGGTYKYLLSFTSVHASCAIHDSA